MRRFLLSIGLVSMLAGCASDPQPMLLNGRYYMAGDAGCIRYIIESPTRIQCYDRAGVAQGYEDAIPHETMQIYVQQQAINRQQIQSLTETIQATSDSIARQNAANAARTGQYIAPATPPFSQTQTTTRCLVNGIYVYCKQQ